MADSKISSLSAASAAAAANEFEINEAGTSKKVTGTQIKTFVTTAPVFAAGTASASTTPKLTSGTVMTTPEAGALEYDGKVFYATPTSGARSVNLCSQFSVLTSDYTLTNQTAVQAAFGSAQDVFTVDASTLYRIEGLYVTTTGATSASLRLAFLFTTATVSYMKVACNGWQGLANTTATASNMTWMDAGAVATVTAAAVTAGKSVSFSGLIAINTGGTITPQVAFSADPTGTLLMKAGSYVMLTPLGSNSVTKIGNVA